MSSICSKFCSGPSPSNTGIDCKLMKSHPDNPNIKIPDPLKHNPKTKEKAINLIINGGRHQICLHNKYRYLVLKDSDEPSFSSENNQR